jgi:hypothetical protein
MEVPKSMNPVVYSPVKTRNISSDPFVREAYFGSPDTPGIVSQAIDAANRVYGTPTPIQKTAGLSPLEIEAMRGAYAGVNSFQPFLDANQRAIIEGIGLTRDATGIARQAADMQFDPSTMIQDYFDPYEDRVVQQTIDDVFKAGEMADVAQRARDIKTGGESAFGSRARLTAEERREALGRGLGQALAGIRSGGFRDARGAAMGEFGRQRGAQERFGATLSGAGRGIAGLGGALGGIGSQAANLAAAQRAELAKYGATARGVKETGLGREFAAKTADRFAPATAATFVKGFLPTYQGGMRSTDVDYSMPLDPRAEGIGTFMNVYSQLQPKLGQPAPPFNPTEIDVDALPKMRLPTDTMMDNPLNPYGAPQRVPPYNQNPYNVYA